MKSWLVFIFLVIFFSSANAQSLSIETGLGFIEGIVDAKSTQEYDVNFKLGLRGTFPLSSDIELYIAPYYLAGSGIDSGIWFNFPVTLESEEGFDSYAGLGLSYLNNRIGLSLVAAISYELDQDSQITLTYSHRPMFSPILNQVFDISLGYKLLLK